MQSTPHTAHTRRSRLANGAIITLSTLILSGVAVAAFEGQHASSRVAEAATGYKPPLTYTPHTDPTEAAFLGDSFTVGVGAEQKFDRWSSLLAQEKGWIELNYGYGGTNYGTSGTLKGGRPYAERLTDLIISNPDIVIVSSAGNALNEDQKQGISKTFQTLRKELPEATIIATSPYYRAEPYPTRLKDFGEEIRREVEAVGGQYIDIGHPLENHPDAMAEDGIHPNEDGYRIIADAVDHALTGL